MREDVYLVIPWILQSRTRSTCAEAAYFRLGLCWSDTRGAITAWNFALLSPIVAEPHGQCLLWGRWRTDWKCHTAMWDDGAHSCPFHGSTSPIAPDESHEAVLHGPVRPQTSADRHAWCSVHQASAMYVSCCLNELPMLIKKHAL